MASSAKGGGFGGGAEGAAAPADAQAAAPDPRHGDADGGGVAVAVDDGVAVADGEGVLDGGAVGLGAAVPVGLGAVGLRVGLGATVAVGVGVVGGVAVPSTTNVVLAESCPRAPDAATMCAPLHDALASGAWLMYAVQVSFPAMKVGLATLAQGLPSHVKLICCVVQGSPADALKLSDAVIPVDALPCWGVMLKVRGASAWTVVAAPAVATATAAAASSQRPIEEGNMCCHCRTSSLANRWRNRSDATTTRPRTAPLLATRTTGAGPCGLGASSTPRD
jgi:hypothetical protein